MLKELFAIPYINGWEIISFPPQIAMYLFKLKLNGLAFNTPMTTYYSTPVPQLFLWQNSWRELVKKALGPWMAFARMPVHRDASY